MPPSHPRPEDLAALGTALSTTAEDAALRQILYDRLGSKTARQLLAKRFPSGSAKRALERRLAELEDRGEAVDDRARDDVLKSLADELIKEMGEA